MEIYDDISPRKSYETKLDRIERKVKAAEKVIHAAKVSLGEARVQLNFLMPEET